MLKSKPRQETQKHLGTTSNWFSEIGFKLTSLGRTLNVSLIKFFLLFDNIWEVNMWERTQTCIIGSIHFKRPPRRCWIDTPEWSFAWSGVALSVRARPLVQMMPFKVKHSTASAKPGLFMIKQCVELCVRIYAVCLSVRVCYSSQSDKRDTHPLLIKVIRMYCAAHLLHTRTHKDWTGPLAATCNLTLWCIYTACWLYAIVPTFHVSCHVLGTFQVPFKIIWKGLSWHLVLIITVG